VTWWSLRRAPKPLGQQGELAAVAYLQRQGFHILERNVEMGRFEIDIIAREGDTVAFIEVKCRRSDDFASPEVNVTPTKQRHIRAAAHQWIDRHFDPKTYYRFDVVAVVLPESGTPDVTLYRNAFPDQAPRSRSVSPRRRRAW
jgi:putative endonuclease